MSKYLFEPFPFQVTPNIGFFVSHSGGKDSQAMYLYLRKIVPPEQLFVIYADLGEVVWKGTIDHIKNTIDNPNQLTVCKAPKTFIQMWHHRQKPPSPSTRQCTSDLKRAPIQKAIKAICKQKGFDVVIDCQGLRAQESDARATKNPFVYAEKETIRNRAWFTWLPIHKLTTDQVFSWIKDNNQIPHWAYQQGCARLSCCLCFYSSPNDLKKGAELNPHLLELYDQMERKYDFTFIMPTKKGGKRFLKEIIGEIPHD